MQVATQIDAKRPKEIANGLSLVLSETRALRQQTRDFHRRLSSPMCRTLQLLLGQQQDELGRAETELAKRVREIGGTLHRTKLPLGSVTSDDTAQAVDERIVFLAQAHETAARSIRSVRELAEQAHDVRTCTLLARRADVHDKAAWALSSMYLGSLMSCELCAGRFTCPLSAMRPAAIVTAVEKCAHAHLRG